MRLISGHSAPSGVATAANAENPVNRFQRVLGASITDLSRAFGVSRQTIYNWKSGESISAENVARLNELSKIVDVLAQEGIESSTSLMRLPISGNLDLRELVRQGRPPEFAARRLIEIVQRKPKPRRLRVD